MVEQPTERERTVARYLASRLTVPEIARELGISPNTMKTHASALYRKLGVTTPGGRRGDRTPTRVDRLTRDSADRQRAQA